MFYGEHGASVRLTKQEILRKLDRSTEVLAFMI